MTSDLDDDKVGDLEVGIVGAGSMGGVCVLCSTTCRCHH